MIKRMKPKKPGLFRRLRKQEDGAVAVEYALTLPIFLALVGLIIEGGWMVFHQQAVTYAAEQATRHAMVNFDATTDDLKRVAAQELDLLDTRNLDAGAIVVDTGDPSDTTRLVSISITFVYEPLFPVFAMLGDPKTGGFKFTGSSEGFLVEDLNCDLLKQLDDTISCD